MVLFHSDVINHFNHANKLLCSNIVWFNISINYHHTNNVVMTQNKSNIDIGIWFYQNMARFTHLPTPSELESMKDDLAFKEGEMHKAQATGVGLAGGKSPYLKVFLQFSFVVHLVSYLFREKFI